jgi:hypothetical protein
MHAWSQSLCFLDLTPVDQITHSSITAHSSTSLGRASTSLQDKTYLFLSFVVLCVWLRLLVSVLSSWPQRLCGTSRLVAAGLLSLSRSPREGGGRMFHCRKRKGSSRDLAQTSSVCCSKPSSRRQRSSGSTRFSFSFSLNYLSSTIYRFLFLSPSCCILLDFAKFGAVCLTSSLILIECLFYFYLLYSFIVCMYLFIF